MKGYDDASYGDAFADVYDEWYEGVTDIEATVGVLAELANDADTSGELAIVELGVGTGRLALPLAGLVAQRRVYGIDSSESMLAVLRGKPDASSVHAIVGDMVEGLLDEHVVGPLALVFVAYNTFFNLDSVDRQQQCFAAVAERLHADGTFVVEAFVPAEPTRSGNDVEVRSIAIDRVVLSVAKYDGDEQVAEGQFIELTETGGVRLRPWRIRYTSPADLDRMAANAGLRLRHRWESFARDPFTYDSTRHVSVYERAQNGADRAVRRAHL